MGATPQARESDVSGRFVRQDATFRGRHEERPEPGRFHLYVSLACPWAHRIVIARRIKRLEDVLPMTVLDPIRDERGWRFAPDRPDPVSGFAFLAEAYARTDPAFDGRVTVPVLFDTAEGRIVSNESEDLLRMVDGWSDEGPDLFPEDLRDEIVALNAGVYEDVNNGVYRCGFASSQEAYEEAYDALFARLDELEARLADHRYLVGDRLTEADIRLFTTLVRFDAVYVGHFRANRNRIVDMPNLHGLLLDLFAHPGFGETVDLDHIKRHYHCTHPSLNPSRIVPKGPDLDFGAPHGRGGLGPQTPT